MTSYYYLVISHLQQQTKRKKKRSIGRTKLNKKKKKTKKKGRKNLDRKSNYNHIYQTKIINKVEEKQSKKKESKDQQYYQEKTKTKSYRKQIIKGDFLQKKRKNQYRKTQQQQKNQIDKKSKQRQQQQQKKQNMENQPNKNNKTLNNQMDEEKQQQNNLQQKAQLKMNILKRLNIIYQVKYYSNKRTLYLCHIIQQIICGITIALLYTNISHNFKYAIYLLPISFLYSLIQIITIHKNIINPKYHIIIQLLSFIIFLSVFLGVYRYIYHPTFKQSFNQAQHCQITKDSRVILQDGSYKENFQVLTLQFNYNGQIYQGCACGSNKYQESIFQTKIEPFRYVTNDEMVSLNIQTSLEEDDISQIKMPSWMCSPYQDYNLRQKDSNGNSNGNSQTNLDKCYFNVYGNQDVALSTQKQQDYCSKSENFMQIIFEEKPYFPVGQFCMLIAFTLLPFFAFSFNWILVIIVHYIIPCLQNDIEKKFFDIEEDKFMNLKGGNKITPNPNNNSDTNSANSDLHKAKILAQQKNNNNNHQLKNYIKENNNNNNKNGNQINSNNNINNNNISISNKNNERIKINLSAVQSPSIMQEDQKNSKSNSQNNSQMIENNKLLQQNNNNFIDCQKSLTQNTIINQQIIQYEEDDYDNLRKISESCSTKNEFNPSPGTTTVLPKKNERIFSQPLIQQKKKYLPPIQGNINIQNILKENIKKEIEDNKQNIDNPIQSQSPDIHNFKKQNKLKYQSSIDLPDVITSSKQTIPSILHNKEKKQLDTSFTQQNKKKSKVQFLNV